MDGQQKGLLCGLTKMYKISDKIINLILKAMENWEVELAAGGQIVEVKIQSDIFQRDSLSPLLLVITMILLNYTLGKSTFGDTNLQN